MRRKSRAGALDLIVLGRDPATRPAGIRARPPHLPEDLHALPGETLGQLASRALSLATGQGVVLALAFYADEVPR